MMQKKKQINRIYPQLHLRDFHYDFILTCMPLQTAQVWQPLYLCVNSTLHNQKTPLLSFPSPCEPQCYNRRVVILPPDCFPRGEPSQPIMLGVIQKAERGSLAAAQAVISVYLHGMKRPGQPALWRPYCFRFANVCHVRAWWWIWCEVDESEGLTGNMCSRAETFHVEKISFEKGFGSFFWSWSRSESWRGLKTCSPLGNLELSCPSQHWCQRS